MLLAPHLRLPDHHHPVIKLIDQPAKMSRLPWQNHGKIFFKAGYQLQIQGKGSQWKARVFHTPRTIGRRLPLSPLPRYQILPNPSTSPSRGRKQELDSSTREQDFTRKRQERGAWRKGERRKHPSNGLWFGVVKARIIIIEPSIRHHGFKVHLTNSNKN